MFIKPKGAEAMKVLLLNGSPRPQGNTALALQTAAEALEAEGIETELTQCGQLALHGCLACGGCGDGRNRCAVDDEVNLFLRKAETAQGFLFGSPVHYAGISGTLKSFLDRAFYAGSRLFAYKPGAGIVAARRGGETPAFDQLNKYFTINKMPVVSSQYWNMVFGGAPGEAALDEEGMQTMRLLGRNMAWLLRCIEVGAERGIAPPPLEPIRRTSFIR
jgi:multimeric flavodoxin WrbA